MKLSDKVEITVGELVSYIYAIADELSSEYGTQYSNENNGIRRMQKEILHDLISENSDLLDYVSNVSYCESSNQDLQYTDLEMDIE